MGGRQRRLPGIDAVGPVLRAVLSREAGSFTATTAHPPLFVNGRQDAASNYERATQVAGAVPGARLITVDGPGHPASFIQNTCLARATAAYLIDLRLPAAGAVCTPDAIPFALA